MGRNQARNTSTRARSGLPSASDSTSCGARGGSSSTSARAQSEHRANPGRYSALHLGQNMFAPRVYYELTLPEFSREVDFDANASQAARVANFSSCDHGALN